MDQPIPHPSPRSKRIPGLDRRAVRVTWTVALMLLLFGAVYAIRRTLFLFIVAMLFAYLLYPLINRIGDRFHHRHRGAALALTYVLVLGILVSIAILIGTQVAAEGQQLVANPPDLNGFLERLGASHPSLEPVVEAAQDRLSETSKEIVSLAPRFSLHVLAASANLIDLVLVPILGFFMLKDGKELRERFLARIPPGTPRSRAESAVDSVHVLLLSYMRALLLLCCTVLVVFSIVLSAMGVPYALLLSTVAFLCEFVPLLGPLTAAAVIVAVSALSGYGHVLWVLVFLGIFRLLQDYFISPKLMGSGVELHPMLVIFGVLAGAEIAGVAGVFLSVPVLALLRLVIDGTRFTQKS
jgi:predicted PurR-regulated permease PerM